MKNKETTKATETNNNQPVHKIRVGSISAAIWQNAFDDGKTKTYRTSLSKHYRDDKGWQQTQVFRAEDLVVLTTVAKLAAEWFNRVESEVVDTHTQQWVIDAARQQRDCPREWFG